nr:hypothetical protein Iba_chr13cCG4630 [Ipomoea batatas]
MLGLERHQYQIYLNHSHYPLEPISSPSPQHHLQLSRELTEDLKKESACPPRWTAARKKSVAFCYLHQTKTWISNLCVSLSHSVS